MVKPDSTKILYKTSILSEKEVLLCMKTSILSEKEVFLCMYE